MPTINEKIQIILDLTKWTQTQLAERLNTTQPTVNRWLNGTIPGGDKWYDINCLYDELEGAFLPEFRTVPLKGRVGAGQEVYAIDDEDHDRTVIAPAESDKNTVAVEVSGDSMFPAFEEGTLLYYSRLLPPHEMVNRRAVVQLADGRIFVKVIRPGTTPTTWNLQSVNAQYGDITDAVIDWAAPIDWTRPRY